MNCRNRAFSCQFWLLQTFTFWLWQESPIYNICWNICIYVYSYYFGIEPSKSHDSWLLEASGNETYLCEQLMPVNIPSPVSSASPHPHLFGMLLWVGGGSRNVVLVVLLLMLLLLIFLLLLLLLLLLFLLLFLQLSQPVLIVTAAAVNTSTTITIMGLQVPGGAIPFMGNKGTYLLISVLFVCKLWIYTCFFACRSS